MLIENIAASRAGGGLVSVTEDGPDDMGKVIAFQRRLSEEKGAAFEKHIALLTEEIERQGVLLCRRADMGEMQKYRGMITRLMNETVSNGYVFSKEEKFGGSKRGRTFAVIRMINEKLDAMTQKILKNEAGNLALLNDVDDIRGLLVDLYF